MKCGVKQRTMRTFTVRARSFSAIAALVLTGAFTPVVASDYRAAMAANGQMNARFLSLGVGKSIVIDLPRDIKDVLVADPKIANAVVRSAQRAYIIGAAVGQTNIVFFDAAGQQIAAYDIAVKRDLNGVRAALRQIVPNSDIQIDGVGDGVVLTGSAATQIEAQQAADLAGRLVGAPEKVVNSIVVRGRDQVMLKVTLAEVRRDIIKQLGIDLNANLNYGTAVVNFSNANPFTAFGHSLTGNTLTTSFGSPPSVQATLRAMESAGVIRTLAEPNVTAVSGESATFIAGGGRRYPERLPAAPSDRGRRIQQVHHRVHRPRRRRPDRRTACRCRGTGADLVPRRYRLDHCRCAGRHAQRARGRRLLPGDSSALGLRRRAGAFACRAALSSARSAPHGRDPPELCENFRGGRPLRPLA